MESYNSRLRFGHRKLNVLQSLGLLVLAYVAGYAVLMERGSPVVFGGKNGELYIQFQSSFRFAPNEYGEFRAFTLWNRIYEPMDNIYFGIFPDQRKFGDKDVLDTLPPLANTASNVR